MKVSMYNWAGSAKNLPSWFKHGEITEVSVDDVMDLYNTTGNNIMLRHADDNLTLLCVDDKGFTQR